VKPADRNRVAAAAAGLVVFGPMAYLVERGQALAFDLPVRAAVHGLASPALTSAMRLITTLGSGYFLVPLAAILVWLWARRGERKAAFLLMCGSLSAELLCEVLKVLFHRPRPEVFFGLSPAVTPSFPSGHALVGTVYYWLLASALATGPRGRAGAVALGFLLGFSRVYLGYHYPSDVLAGWGLAAVWLALWTAIAKRRTAG
jgi:undecaprenyl-diphosphatase